MISATLYTDPACPWAYSESPALRVIEWRYGDQLDWRLVLVGLTETRRPSTPSGGTRRCGERSASSLPPLRDAVRAEAKERVSATARACRAVVAARHVAPGQRVGAFPRAPAGQLQRPPAARRRRQLREVLRAVPGIDAEEIVAALDSPEVTEAYERDRAETRKAAGSAAELQGKTATTDGPVRFTAPSIVFQSNGARLVAGGFQPVEAYDVLVANLDPTLHRELPPETPEPLLERFPGGLTTQEVAALMTHEQRRPDRPAAEAALIELVADGAGRARVDGRRRALEARRPRRQLRQQRQRLQTVDPRRGSELGLAVELDRLDALGEERQPLLHLGAGQVGAHAVVDAGAERQHPRRRRARR